LVVADITRQYLQSNELDNPSNLLAQLLPLTNLPKLPEDLNAFYVSSLSQPPTGRLSTSIKLSKSKKSKKPSKASKEVEALPDWMDTYESDASTDSEDGSGKRKRKERTARLSMLASIHSIPSHIAVYTHLWEAIFSRVRLSETWQRKILVGLHGERGILGHMRPDRRLRVADWLGGLVDKGGPEGMLAMNGLFVLMTQYNL
jgi:U3 small nucleolar RNA-associated protein 19